MIRCAISNLQEACFAFFAEGTVNVRVCGRRRKGGLPTFCVYLTRSDYTNIFSSVTAAPAVKSLVNCLVQLVSHYRFSLLYCIFRYVDRYMYLD